MTDRDSIDGSGKAQGRISLDEAWMEATSPIVPTDEWIRTGDPQWDEGVWEAESDGESPGWRVEKLGSSFRVRYGSGWYVQEGDARDGEVLFRLMRAMVCAAKTLNAALSEDWPHDWIDPTDAAYIKAAAEQVTS